jgi:hypothetical protein
MRKLFDKLSASKVEVALYEPFAACVAKALPPQFHYTCSLPTKNLSVTPS